MYKLDFISLQKEDWLLRFRQTWKLRRSSITEKTLMAFPSEARRPLAKPYKRVRYCDVDSHRVAGRKVGSYCHLALHGDSRCSGSQRFRDQVMAKNAGDGIAADAVVPKDIMDWWKNLQCGVKGLEDPTTIGRKRLNSTAENDKFNTGDGKAVSHASEMWSIRH